MKLIFNDYRTGKQIKSVTIKSQSSITYEPEGDRMVIRNYWDGKVIQSCKMPEQSCTFEARP